MPSLDDLFLALLREIHFAERQILRALPRMARAARNGALREAFTRQCANGRVQQVRLGEVFRRIGWPARAETSEAILGLLQDCEDLLGDVAEPGPVHDAGLIACGQALAHYEMSRYGTLLAWAEAMERPEIAALLRQTLEEERAVDRALAHLATRTVNREARAAA